MIINTTDRVDDELARLSRVTGLTTDKLISAAITLLRIHVKAAQNGHTIIQEYEKGCGIGVIKLPFPVNDE